MRKKVGELEGKVISLLSLYSFLSSLGYQKPQRITPKPMKSYPKPTQAISISKALCLSPSSHEPRAPKQADMHTHLLAACTAGEPEQQFQAGVVLVTQHSPAPAAGMQQPSMTAVLLSSGDLWVWKENKNSRCPVPMTEQLYIASNKACDNSSINSHSNRSERQLIITAT